MKQLNLRIFIILAIIVTTILGENCDKYGILVYEDLGCTPHYENNNKDTCPKKFSCVGLEPWKDKCYFRGQNYQNKEKVPKEVSRSPCEACQCTQENNKADFVCAVFDCIGPKKLDCHMKYTLDQCCGTEEICPPFETCKVNGKEYKEGERFYPENSCLECVCSKGFKMEEPFCRRRSCVSQFMYSEETQKKCAPIYGKRSDGLLCCPHSWICGDGTEKILGDGNDGDTCKFGEKILKTGQKFEKEKFNGRYGSQFGKSVCECIIPPLVTCKEV